MKRSLAALVFITAVTIPSLAHATGFFVGPGGAKVPQPVANVIIVRAPAGDTVFVAPRVVSPGTDRRIAYVLPVPAGIAEIELGDDSVFDREWLPAAPIVIEREVDPCGAPPDPRPALSVDFSKTPGAVPHKPDTGPNRHPLPLTRTAPALATTEDVARALDVPLDADAAKVVAAWLEAGARPVVARLPESHRLPILRFTLPRAPASTLPTTPPSAGGAHEVLLDVLGTARVAYTAAGAWRSPAGVVETGDRGAEAWVDAFFAQHPAGVIEEAAGRPYAAKDEALLATLTGADQTRPPIFASRLRLRPSGAPLRITTEPLAGERSTRYTATEPWRGAISCAEPNRGRFERQTRYASGRLSSVKISSPPPAPTSLDGGPKAIPPQPSAAPPPPVPPPTSGCAGVGAGWVALLLARALRRRAS